ncbi:MAG: 30S ribosomal protein S4 [Firmicutes bacterium]|nr:30S ribosomal protein S4 [Bacillota bacterium]
MARYTGPACRLCRRAGEKLFLKGERCYTNKCSIDRRNYGPGQHGQARRGKASEYALQMREKQKLRRIYGIMEAQFENYFEKAARKTGVTGEMLLQLLERRLDNVVYRLGFALSRAEARQLVRHGHIQVNGRKVNIPSYLVAAGDEVSVKEASRKIPRMVELSQGFRTRNVPKWLELNPETWTGKVLALPRREDIDMPVEEHLIVEFYSR